MVGNILSGIRLSRSGGFPYFGLLPRLAPVTISALLATLVFIFALG